MPFQIIPATISDVPELISIYHSAFANDATYTPTYSRMPPAAQHELDTRNFTNLFHQSWIRIFKAVDTSTSKIVGYSQWQLPHTATDREAAQEIIAHNDRECVPWHELEGVNVPFCIAMYRHSERAQEIWMNPDRDAYLCVLGVIPDYRGLGLGEQLVRVGTEIADACGVKTYVEASPMALGLYTKMGWRIVGSYAMELSRFGGVGEYDVIYMVREPVGKAWSGDVLTAGKELA